MAISSVHFNRNLLCSIDVETTGLIPGKHEVCQIGIVPLAPDLTPSKEFGIFELRIKPERVHHIDGNYVGLNRKLIQDTLINGMERWAAVDYVSDWFYKKLKLAPGKKIVPLGCNYEGHDMPFLVDFFGGTLSYQEFFRSDVRDVQRAACMINDLADIQSTRIPFPKYNLQYLCSCLEIVNEHAHDALHDAVATAECYRRILRLAPYYIRVPTDEFNERFNALATQYAAYVVKNPENPVAFNDFRRAWEHSFGLVL